MLDAVDGQVARRTGTATPFGARFDGEVDAFLILVLSVAVSRDYGGWVLAIGAARYVLLIAGWLVPWLAAPLPPRYWGKVVAAVQGIVLTVAVSGVLPRPVGMIAVGVALLLLAESFGRSVVWLYRTGAGPRTRRALRLATALVAAAIVWAVLVAPDPSRPAHPGRVRPHPAGGAGPGRDRAGAAAPAADGSWRRQRESRSACSPSSRSSTSASPRSSAGRSTRCSTGARSARRSGCCATRSARPRTDVAVVLAGLAVALLVAVVTAVDDPAQQRHRPAPAPLGSRARRPGRGVGGVRRAVAATRPGRPRRLDEHRRTGRRART